MLTPKKTLNIVDSWNNDNAYATLIFEKTKFVEYCIIPTRAISPSWNLMLGFEILSLCLEQIAKNVEKTSPAPAQKKNAVEIFERRIIFFIKIASVPEKISASIL